MISISFFTRDELSQAFSLLLPPGRADSLAARWFAAFAQAVDADGRVVRDEPWSFPDAKRLEQFDGRDATTVERVRRDEALFDAFDGESIETVLFAFGNVTISLAALVNDDLFERMRIVRGLTIRQARDNRLHLQRAVTSFRLRGGW